MRIAQARKPRPLVIAAVMTGLIAGGITAGTTTGLFAGDAPPSKGSNGEAAMAGSGGAPMLGGDSMSPQATGENGYAGPAKAGTAGAEEALKPIPNRFMTWNTNGQKLGTPEAIAEQIKRFRPQVVAVQESCVNEVREAVQLLDEAGLKYEYREGLVALNTCPVGTAIIYAKGTTVRAHNKKGYSDDEGWLEARGMQSFTTKVYGQSVRVFNTHLSAPAEEDLREQQVKELADATRPHPRALIIGDLNTRPHATKVMNPIWNAGFRDVDPFCGPKKDSRCTKTLPRTGPPVTREESKYDYILGRGVNFRNCMMHTPTEDHRIVISDLTVTAVRPPACTVT